MLLSAKLENAKNEIAAFCPPSLGDDNDCTVYQLLTSARFDEHLK
jgi:hypothetical protein